MLLATWHFTIISSSYISNTHINLSYSLLYLVFSFAHDSRFEKPSKFQPAANYGRTIWQCLLACALSVQLRVVAEIFRPFFPDTSRLGKLVTRSYLTRGLSKAAKKIATCACILQLYHYRFCSGPFINNARRAHFLRLDVTVKLAIIAVRRVCIRKLEVICDENYILRFSAWNSVTHTSSFRYSLFFFKFTYKQ